MTFSALGDFLQNDFFKTKNYVSLYMFDKVPQFWWNIQSSQYYGENIKKKHATNDFLYICPVWE